MAAKAVAWESCALSPHGCSGPAAVVRRSRALALALTRSPAARRVRVRRVGRAKVGRQSTRHPRRRFALHVRASVSSQNEQKRAAPVRRSLNKYWTRGNNGRLTLVCAVVPPPPQHPSTIKTYCRHISNTYPDICTDIHQPQQHPNSSTATCCDCRRKAIPERNLVIALACRGPGVALCQRAELSKQAQSAPNGPDALPSLPP